jgi:DNA-binding beta-propeller fold protein YncE
MQMNLPGPLSVLNPTRLHFAGALLGALALLGGCVATPTKTPVAAKQEAVFYPRPPDAPRVQHLATYAGARDLEIDKSGGGLKDFLLGDEKSEDALVRPYGVAMSDGKIYVADSRGPGLAIFDLKARKYSLMSGSGSGRMQRPINVAIDVDGTKYVTDTGRNQILVYDRGDSFVTAYGAKDEFKPVDVAIAGERLYVVDIEHHEVRVMDKRSGKLQFKFGRSDAEAEKALHQPTNLAIGREGDIYVVETGNFRVARFTPEGKFVRHYGEAGQAPGQFARPKGIAMDRAGRLYVGDAAFQNVQIFDNEGRVLMAFGQPVEGSQGLNLPAGVAVDYDNVALFRSLAAPGFAIEHLILVVSQFGPNQVDVFGFGKMSGAAYPPDDPPDPKPAR